MNNETLVKDLCARLPYGVKFKYSDPYDHELDVVKTINEIDIIAKCFCDETGSRYKFSSATTKPLLFPSLTKPITINGETFVPADKIGKSILGGRTYIDDLIKYQKAYNTWPLFVIDKMTEWHINYRLSPNQFVAVTESYNPYK